MARGVQMEAESIEDGGQAVRFNVFVYNVEPGVEIDYVTGKVGSRATCHMWRPVARQPLPARARRRTQLAKRPAAHLPKNPAEMLAQRARILRPLKGNTEKSQTNQANNATSSGDAKNPSNGAGSGGRIGHLIWVARIRTQHQEHEISPPDLLFSVDDIADDNKQEATATRDELISKGYSPCKQCNP